MAPVSRLASNPRTLAMTFCGEFGPPKKAPPSLENRAESEPPPVPSEDATVRPYVGELVLVSEFPALSSGNDNNWLRCN